MHISFHVVYINVYITYNIIFLVAINNVLRLTGFISDSKRQFKWVDNTPLNSKHFLNWNTGEPNNAHKEDEDCGSMVTSSKKIMKWNDMRCLENSALGYVCESERKFARGY